MGKKQNFAFHNATPFIAYKLSTFYNARYSALVKKEWKILGHDGNLSNLTNHNDETEWETMIEHILSSCLLFFVVKRIQIHIIFRSDVYDGNF